MALDTHWMPQETVEETQKAFETNVRIPIKEKGQIQLAMRSHAHTF